MNPPTSPHAQISRTALAAYLDTLLEVTRIKDYCPNGLQIEGRAEISHIVTGVSASRALLEAAINAGADAILVHHGYFWKGEDGRITGTRKQRIATLLQHDVSLFAYHLPLDAHPTLGNNIQLAQRLNLKPASTPLASLEPLVWCGEWQRPDGMGSLAHFQQHIHQQLGREPLVIGNHEQLIRRVAWCTGGAQNFFEAALVEGIDAYLTGEISEQHYHLAQETGVAFISAGHHATERYGIQALGEHLATQFGIQHTFIDIDNPV